MDNPRRFLYNGGKDMGKGDMRMASIRCRACGSVYDYDKEGFCPKCGAYAVKKESKNGNYIKCSNKNCDFKRDIDKKD